MKKPKHRKRRRITLKEVFDFKEGLLVTWIKKSYGKFIVNYFAIYIMAFIIVTIGIIALSSKYYDEEFYKRVLAGAHGLVLNMFVLGIIVFWLTKKGQTLSEIQRYQEEINNLRGLKTKEVSRQLRMLISMLNKRGVTRIDLSGCYFEYVVLDGFNLVNSDFSGSTFDSGTFYNCNLTGCNFYNTEFNSFDFDECDMTRTDFSHAKLTYVNYMQCILESISFHNTNFNYVDLAWHDLTNVDFAFSIIDEVHFHHTNLEGAFFHYTNFKDSDDITQKQLSEVETLYDARFSPEMEKRLNISRLKQMNPKLFEEPEWFMKRKPRYRDDNNSNTDEPNS